MQYVKTNKTTRYIYDESGISDMAVYENGELSEIYRFEKNIFGDVIAIYDNNAVLQCTYKYDAFGYPRVYDGNGSILKDDTNIGASNPIRYRGYYYDTETGLYYLQSRYYDPRSKRFISPDDPSYLDPAIVGGMNPYAYCMNNPVMYVDPSGHFAFILIGLIIGAVIGSTVVGKTAYEIAAANGATGWELLGWTVLGAVGGAVIGGAIGAGMGYIGGVSLSGIGTSIGSSIGSQLVLAGSSVGVMSVAAMLGAIDVIGMTYLFTKTSRPSAKQRASDKPSYVNRDMVDPNLSAQENATNILDNKFGKGNWKKGPKTDFNKIVKWITRTVFRWL